MSFSFPCAFGKNPVGVFSFEITDKNRLNHDGSICKQRRIPVRTFYPTKNCSLPLAKYLSEEASKSVAKTYHCNAVLDKDIETKCIQNALPIDGKSPLLIFNHGLGGYDAQNTILCTDLASLGYIVVSVCHPSEALYAQYQDGSIEYYDKKSNIQLVKPILSSCIKDMKLISSKNDRKKTFYIFDEWQRKYCTFFMGVVPIWEQDCISVLDFLCEKDQEHIDFTRVGAFGHSFGGSTSLALLKDERVRCAINIDGAVYGEHNGNDFGKPTLTICCKENVNLELGGFINNSAPSYLSLFSNMKHIGFMDLKYLPGSGSKFGTYPPERLREALFSLTHNFFTCYLEEREPSHNKEFPMFEGLTTYNTKKM